MGLSKYFKYGKSLESLSDAIVKGNITHAYIIEGDSLLISQGLQRLLQRQLYARKNLVRDVTSVAFVSA